jgi:hypothetical protein
MQRGIFMPLCIIICVIAGDMRVILLIIFTLIFINAFSQNSITISGYVRDSVSLESLNNATVYEGNSKHGVVSNAYGFYSLSVAPGKVKMAVSFVGYRPRMFVFEALNDTTLNFNLSAENNLGEIIVKANAGAQNYSGHEQLNMDDVKALPAFVGEQDVLKSLAVLPGVSQGHEGSAGLFVRGGSPDQNLILLDGVPVFNASHLFGFVSVFTPEAIQSVDFYKGGFPARFGGCLSSVVDVRMKEGNKNNPETDLTVGVVSSKLTQQGPIQQGKSSYLVSFRRTLLDLFVTGAAKLSQMSSSESIVPGLNFYDADAKFNFDLNRKNRLYLSLYAGGDHLFSSFKDQYSFDNGETSQNTKVKLNWGNRIGALRWTSQLGNRLYLNATLSSGTFKYNIHNRYSQSVENEGNKSELWSDIEYLTLVNNNKVQTLFDGYLANHKIQFGFSGEMNRFVPGRQEIERSDSIHMARGNHKIKNTGYSFFVDDRFNLNPEISAYAGLRFDAYNFSGRSFTYFQPRINLKYTPLPLLFFNLSFAKMVQPLHLLTNSSIGLPSDIWIPATSMVPPELSRQITFGVNFRLNDFWHYDFDSYYKTMEGVINYKAGYSFMDIYGDWEKLVEKGSGKAWGFEHSLGYEDSRVKSWLNYTLSWNQRKFENINNGEAFPFKFDRRHDINLGFIYKIGKNADLSAVWVYQSGQAATIPTQDYQAPGAVNYRITDFITGIEISDADRIQYFGKYNASRLPAFHHLDLGLTIKRQRGNVRSEWQFSIYNAYARQNPYMYYPHSSPDGRMKYRQVCIFPIIPSVSYHVRF